MKQRTKTVALCIIAIAVAITIAMPQKISAASDPKKPKATNVVYVTDGQNNRTGIKTFTISPYVYYNLSQDEVINDDHQRTLKLNDAKLLQIAKQQIFPKWSIIAEGIFREQADQLVTIEGTKMMSSSTAVAESFDRHFCTGKVSNGYTSEDWSVNDLANELRQEKSSQKGKTCWDEVRVTGITQIGSLNGARTLMGQELRNCSDDDDVSKDDFLGNNHQKNEDKRRLPDLEDDKSGDGFANIVTCVNRAGASGDYDYVTFGLAVYDFDITPVAAENLKYVEAADETFPDGESTVKGEDILMGLAGDHVDKTGISFHNDTENGTTSYLRNNTTQEVTQSSGLENSVTEESTLSTDDTFEWGMEQEIGVEMNFGGYGGIGEGSADNPAPCMFPRATVHMSNSWHELWSTTKSTSETKSATKTKTTNTEVTLPGHTIATVNQSLTNTKTTENYQQPVILSYKVAIFAMSGDYFNGIVGGIENSRYDKQWMSVLFDGSDDYETSGCKALGSLYNRAVVNKDTQGYDGAKGKYKTWCDKAAWVKSGKIDWNDISIVLSLDNRDSHRITLGNGKKATTVKDLATELPLIEKAQMLTSKRESITSSVDQIIPLYSLDSVNMKTGSAEYDLAPGSTLYLDSIDVEGFDKDGAEFYEFDKGWGEWVLMNGDDAIEDNKSGDESDVKDEIKVGAITLVNDSQLGNQKVVVAPESAGTDEKHYLSWKLKKGEGTKICSNEELNRPNDSDDPRWMTDEEKAEVDTPSILVRVKFSENDIANFEVGGTYKGPMDEPLNLNHVLTADAVDSTGKIRGVSVFWEAKELSGITVEESGETKFSRKGTYHVRPYSRDMEGHKIVPKDDTVNPVWLEVVAQDRASLSSIVISKPDFEDADTTLSEGITALGFDLASYTKFLDQYGEKWEGTKDNPLPVVKYSVSGPNGAAVDREGILTITRPGTYKVTAKAYDMDQEDIGINIDPITIVVTESDYLASITMKEPGMSGPELTLKEKGDYIVIKNLEELLTYKDQNNRLWEGTKPDVTFSLARDPQNAEIKGGNFYAYAPGTYTIVPFADGYKVNSVTITITEEEQDAEDFKNLVLKTEDPGKQYLYTEDDVVELELERFINAATRYGSRWNERVPELKFTLENAKGASIETRTVYDGDDDYVGADKHFFKSSVAGEYIVHVQPRKASEYTKPLDDMLIKVVKGKKVARIEFKDIQSEVDPEDLMINVYNSDYPSIDLSKYLNYYDGFGNLIDPAKDHVKIPDCKYGFVYPESYSEESYELKGSTLTSYEPDVYLVKATMNMTNYEPSDPSDENAKEDIILEAKAGIFFFDINWLHDFGSWKTTKEPTCTADGSRIKECTGGPDCMNNKSGEGTVACNVKIADSIPATGHKWSASYRYSADKNYLYTVCEECGEKMEASITPCPKAPVFTWKDAAAGIPAPSKVPTCTTEGEYNVKTQSGTTVTVKVPALGHAWGSKFTVKTGDEATCTKYGKESIVCERAGCGEIRKDEGCQRTIPKLEHEYDWKYDVDKDGKELKETCGDYGSMVAQCRKCSIKLYDVVPPTGNHKWSAKTVTKATPNRDGTISKVCGVCGKEEVRTIDHPVCKLSKNTCTYNGKAKNPAVKVTADGYGLNKAYYKVTYSNNIKAGKATVKIAFRGDQYTGAKTLKFTIKKAANPLKIKAKTAMVKFGKVKKKNQKLKVSKVIKVVKKGQGIVTYTKKSGTKKITISKKTGKVTVKKGLKKGTYKVKVRVKAKGNANYKASKWKTVTFKIKVK